MKLLVQTILSTALLLTLFSGCTQQPKPAEEIKSDPSLPTVSINGFLSDMNAIAFEWKKIEDPRVQGIFIYRNKSGSEEEKLNRIAIVENRFNTHYTDQAVKPGTDYEYIFTSYSDLHTQSAPSKKQSAKTLPLFDSVSFFRTIGKMPRSAKLIWRPHTNVKAKSYIIERKSEDDTEWKQIAVINNRLSAEYIDTDLDDNAIYYYRILVKTFDGIVSNPSETVKVITKPLPLPIKNVQTSKNQPKQITITWAASENGDIDYYNIYRASTLDGTYEYHAKLKETAFVDKIDRDGAHYYYKITAVDKDGLEGTQSNIPVEGTTLSKPKKPMLVEVKFINHSFRLHWKNADKRTVSFSLIKTTKVSWIKNVVEEIENIKETQYTDLEIAADTSYSYQVVAIDNLGIRSEPTEPVEISFKAK